MGRAKLVRGSIRSTERDRNIELPAGHHEHVGSVVHDLIESDQRKAPRHKLDDRPQSGHGRADSKARESVFADWCVDDAPGPKELKQTLAHFESAVIFRDFIAHQKSIRL